MSLKKLKRFAEKNNCELDIDRDEKTVQLWSPIGFIFQGNGCSRICSGTDPDFSIIPVYEEVLDIALHGLTEADMTLNGYWWSD